MTCSRVGGKDDRKVLRDFSERIQNNLQLVGRISVFGSVNGYQGILFGREVERLQHAALCVGEAAVLKNRVIHDVTNEVYAFFNTLAAKIPNSNRCWRKQKIGAVVS